jgi:hypothetical protein
LKERLPEKRGDANYKIVDFGHFQWPFLGTTEGTAPGIAAFLLKLKNPIINNGKASIFNGIVPYYGIFIFSNQLQRGDHLP